MLQLYDSHETVRLASSRLVAGRVGYLADPPPRGPRARGWLTLALALAALPAGGFRLPQDGSDASRPAIRFTDVTAAVGVQFRHFAGRTEFKYVPETMGAGVAWLDYDGDGRWDLYFVDSGVLPGVPPARTPPAGAGRNRLYRASPGGRFRQAPEARVADDGYGMGVAVGDYDGDGWGDLLVTNFGPNALYRNNGDGTFTDVTEAMGAGDARWGTSAAWGDLDLDGLPELFVANYLDYRVPNPRVCGDVARGVRAYCPPDLFDGTPDLLYANRAGVKLEDVAGDAGLVNPADGKGLGVVIADLDNDSVPDIYVANDATRNFLYLNRGELHFEDQGLFSGAGLSSEGYPQSGMGVDVADLDGDGLPEIGVTNYEKQAINLYRSIVDGLFQDQTFAWGAGEATVLTLGFGIVFCDLDGDGDQDVFVANGHPLDTAQRFAQPNQVFANLRADRQVAARVDADTGLLREVSSTAGSAVTRERVSRGVAYGDLDADGWPDLAVTNMDGPAEILRNSTPGSQRRLVLRIRGRRSNRDAFGAQVVVVSRLKATGAAYEQHFDIKSGSSYVSQGSSDLYVGLGDAVEATARILWPGGADEDLGSLTAGSIYLAVEGHGVVAHRSLAARHDPTAAAGPGEGGR